MSELLNTFPHIRKKKMPYPVTMLNCWKLMARPRKWAGLNSLWYTVMFMLYIPMDTPWKKRPAIKSCNPIAINYYAFEASRCHLFMLTSTLEAPVCMLVPNQKMMVAAMILCLRPIRSDNGPANRPPTKAPKR